MLAFGHRGAAGHAPENTLASIQKALDLGVDWIEVDVQNVEDKLIVFHDSRLDRTTNGKGPVSKHTIRDIRALDAGHGERIPLLHEVLDLMNRQCGINIELKGPDTAAGTVEIVQEYVREKKWNLKQFLISSFDSDQLAEARHLSENIPVAPLYVWPRNQYVNKALDLKAAAIHIHERFVRKRIIAKIHAHHMNVHVYTVNNMIRILALQEMGVDGIFSDYPERIIKARNIS